MKEYTAKEIKLLKANPYTFKVTKNKLYFTAEFKEAFWVAYQAGIAPRKIMEDLGYDLGMFGQNNNPGRIYKANIVLCSERFIGSRFCVGDS